MKNLVGALLVVAVSGCFMAPPEGALSAPGSVTVSVQVDPRVTGLDCVPNVCNLNRPLMTGTRETFSAFLTVPALPDMPSPVSPTTTPLFTGRCKDETVCTLQTVVMTCCSNQSVPCSKTAPGDAAQTWDRCLAGGGEPHLSQTWTISAVGVGMTDVELEAIDTPGQSVTTGPFDRFPVTVRDAARLEVQLPSVVTQGNTTGPSFSTVSPLVLAGRHAVVRTAAFDASGARLWASDAVTMKVESDLAQFWGDRSEVGWFGELWPMARGTTKLHLTAPTATAEVELISQ